jgi:hypothetical protein
LELAAALVFWVFEIWVDLVFLRGCAQAAEVFGACCFGFLGTEVLLGFGLCGIFGRPLSRGWLHGCDSRAGGNEVFREFVFFRLFLIWELRAPRSSDERGALLFVIEIG